MSEDSGSGRKHGFVYVMSNPSMPGLFKIGSTERHPALRAEELSGSTGVPSPFVVMAYLDVFDRWKAEQASHKALGPHRESSSREFYRMGLRELLARLVDAVAEWRGLTAANPGQCPRCGASVRRYHPAGRWDGDPTSPWGPGGTLFRATCARCGVSLLSSAAGEARAEDLFWCESE